MNTRIETEHMLERTLETKKNVLYKWSNFRLKV